MFSTGLHHVTTNTQTQPKNFQETLLISSRFSGFPGGKNSGTYHQCDGRRDRQMDRITIAKSKSKYAHKNLNINQ